MNRHINSEVVARMEEGTLYKNIKLPELETIVIAADDDPILLFSHANDNRYIVNDQFAETRNVPFGIFLSQGDEMSLTLGEEGEISIFTCYDLENYRKHLARLDIVPDNKKDAERRRTFSINSPLKGVLDSLRMYYGDGLRSEELMEAKLHEVFMVIATYYEHETIVGAFGSLLDRAISFEQFVLLNHLKAKSVKEFAEMRGIPLRQFNNEFKETFGMPPYKWMLEERANEVKRQLADGTIPFKKIMEELHFSSPSHFTVFCKRQFGMTPTELQKKLMKERESEEEEAQSRTHLLF